MTNVNQSIEKKSYFKCNTRRKTILFQNLPTRQSDSFLSSSESCPDLNFFGVSQGTGRPRTSGSRYVRGNCCRGRSRGRGNINSNRGIASDINNWYNTFTPINIPVYHPGYLKSNHEEWESINYFIEIKLFVLAKPNGVISWHMTVIPKFKRCITIY